MRRTGLSTCLTLLLAAVVPLSGAVRQRHRRPRIRSRFNLRFSFTPWLMTAGGGGRRVSIPGHPSNIGLIERFSEWAPPPDAVWSPAPDPRAIGYSRTTGLPSAKFAIYAYFRTALNVPRSVSPASVVMRFGHIDDAVAVYVDGRRVPYDPYQYADSNEVNFTIPIGRYLHPGRNSIRLMLADWYDRTALTGVTIESDADVGRLAAVLPGDPPGRWIFSNGSAAEPSLSSPRPRPDVIRRGFGFTGWTASAGNGGRPIPVFEPSAVNLSFTSQMYARLRHRMPKPAPRWTAVPGRAINFNQVTHVPCAAGLGAFFYFQTRLTVPAGPILRSARLDIGRIDDFAGAFINGRPVLSGPPESAMSIPIGRYLHPGTNTVRLFLIDVCELAILNDVQLTSRTAAGRPIEPAVWTRP